MQQTVSLSDGRVYLNRSQDLYDNTILDAYRAASCIMAASGGDRESGAPVFL